MVSLHPFPGRSEAVRWACQTSVEAVTCPQQAHMWPQNDFRRLIPSIEPTVDHIRFTELRLGHRGGGVGGGAQSRASPECMAQRAFVLTLEVRPWVER